MAPMITGLADLCDYFGADEPRSLNRRIYNATACGASISVYLPDGAAIHNGSERWATLTRETPIRGFTIQTIVEGSDATVDSSEFKVPVECEKIGTWIGDMEGEAERLWKEANAD